MSRRPRPSYPSPDPHFEAGSIKFYFLSELVDMIPRPTRPSRETILRLIRAGKIRGRKLGREWIVTETAWAEFCAGFDANEPGPDAAS
jgi:hypothetical protein